jgi:hypothetical protein
MIPRLLRDRTAASFASSIIIPFQHCLVTCQRYTTERALSSLSALGACILRSLPHPACLLDQSGVGCLSLSQRRSAAFVHQHTQNHPGASTCAEIV